MPRKRRAVSVSEDEPEEEEAAPPSKRATNKRPSKATNAKGKAKPAAAEPATPPPATRRSTRDRKPRKVASSSSGSEEEEEEEVAVREALPDPVVKKPAPAARKSRAKPRAPTAGPPGPAPAAAAAEKTSGGASGSAPPAVAAASPAPTGLTSPRLDRTGHTVAWLGRPTPKVQERIAKALPGAKNRMFLIEADPLAPMGYQGSPSQSFKVLGASASVYTVTIRKHTHCTCPDHSFNRPETGGLCKHILFVLMRVLKLRPDDPLLWQRALTDTEVAKLVGAAGGAAADAAGMAPEEVRQLFLRATGREQRAAPAPAAAAAGPSTGALEPGRRPIEGDCPICFEELDPQGNEAFSWCVGGCGNNFHEGCSARWTAQKQGQGQEVTCVLCRHPWKAAGGGGGGGAGGRGGAAVRRGGGAGRGHHWGNLNLSQYAAEQRDDAAADAVALAYVDI